MEVSCEVKRIGVFVDKLKLQTNEKHTSLTNFILVRLCMRPMHSCPLIMFVVLIVLHDYLLDLLPCSIIWIISSYSEYCKNTKHFFFHLLMKIYQKTWFIPYFHLSLNHVLVICLIFPLMCRNGQIFSKDDKCLRVPLKCRTI